ncbi:RNA helicase, partial [Micromonospora sp. MS34]
RGERRFGDRDDRRFGDRRGAGERDSGADRRLDDRPSGGRDFGHREGRGERRFADRGERGPFDRDRDERRFGDGDGRADRRFGERGGDFRSPDRRGGFRPETRGRDDRRGFGGRPPARTH